MCDQSEQVHVVTGQILLRKKNPIFISDWILNTNQPANSFCQNIKVVGVSKVLSFFASATKQRIEINHGNVQSIRSPLFVSYKA